MATATIEEGKLKDLIKTALIEVLDARRDLMQEIVEEAIEDFAFSRAIEQGMTSGKVSRGEVFAILEGKE
ncbi:MAG: hypothetical protein M3367_16025 [Acidobacteriota bacterium]|nr:hypothetical protein [Acidobacteriota bacterium]